MNHAPRQTQRKTLTAPIRRIRFAWVAIFFCLWVVTIGLRLVWLQVIRHSEWVDKAERQQQQYVCGCAAARGPLRPQSARAGDDGAGGFHLCGCRRNWARIAPAPPEMLAKVVHTDPTDSFTAEAQMLARFNDSKTLCLGGAAGGCGHGGSRPSS